MKGYFVVLEGTDGSGKTEQFKLLLRALKQAGKKVLTVDFPQYGKPSAYYVEQYLHGVYGTWQEVGPMLASAFYALDRIDAARAIRAHLAKGGVVLANRYVGSNMGHQGAKIKNTVKRRELLKWIYDFEYNICRIPKPDINIFLHVPSRISYKLISRKGERAYLKGKKRDIHEADFNHLKQAEASYQDAVRLFPRDFKVIECAPDGKLLSIESIHQEVTRRLPLLAHSRAASDGAPRSVSLRSSAFGRNRARSDRRTRSKR